MVDVGDEGGEGYEAANEVYADCGVDAERDLNAKCEGKKELTRGNEGVCFCQLGTGLR